MLSWVLTKWLLNSEETLTKNGDIIYKLTILIVEYNKIGGVLKIIILKTQIYGLDPK